MTSNEQLFDALLRHQIGLFRLGARVRDRILTLLDETEKDLADQIARRLRNNGGVEDAKDIKRLEAIKQSVSALRTEAWKKSLSVWREELLEMAKAESTFLGLTFSTVSVTTLDLAFPNQALLEQLVRSKPFQGKTLKEWAANIAAADISRINNQIAIGMVEGETGEQIARRVVGTARLKGTDGVTQISRKDAEGLTRTAINAIANDVKKAFYRSNQDIIKEEIYVATLDSRTTPVCRALDGRIFAVGKGPYPPRHFNCRSVRVPAINGRAIGTRPLKKSTEQMLVREYKASKGIRGGRASRSSLPRGHKGSYDNFARRRTRELTGTTPAHVNYQDFLRRQSHEFQDDVLGPTRAKLFRQGGITLDRFVDRSGKQYTLSELAIRDSAAFRAAGLNPDDFL